MINLHFRLPRVDHTDILYDQDEEWHREKQDQMQEAFLTGCHQACIWNESGDGEKQVDLKNIQETEGTMLSEEGMMSSR